MSSVPPVRLALALAVLSLCFSTVLADSHVPGTRVSYRLAEDPLTDLNSSMVFIDALEDTTGKTYASFVCEDGMMYFKLYSRTPIFTVAEQNMKVDLPLYFRMDTQAIESVSSHPREDRYTGKLTVTETYLADSRQVLRAFLNASQQVVIRLNLWKGGPLTLTFPVKGFRQAFIAINGCY